MVVGHGAQRAADARALEEQRQPGDQQAGDHGRPDVELVHQDAAVEQRFEDEDRLLGQADIERIDVGAEHGLGQPLEEEGDADRRHEQDDAFLVHQLAQHQPLGGPGDDRHDDGGEQEGGGQRQAERPVPFLLQEIERAHQRQRRRQHHRALGEVEHAGRLEDQHEAQRHQRVEDAGEQAADQDFEEETHYVALFALCFDTTIVIPTTRIYARGLKVPRCARDDT